MERIELTDACSLEPGPLVDRRAVWQRVSESVTDRRSVADGFEVRYHATPEVVDALPRLAEAEAGCCGFARWDVRTEADQVVLTVTGTDPGMDALRREFGIDP